MNYSRPEETNPRNHFHINYFEKWEQFMTTWKPVWFSYTLNQYDEEALTIFWEKQLNALASETQKISILVPLKVKKEEPKEQKLEDNPTKTSINGQIKQSEQLKKESLDNEKQIKQQKNSRNNKNGQKKEGPPMVKLNKKVIEVAIKLVKQKFPELRCHYESLFMGNDKQLLIYRHCASMVRYLERYRLPKDFKERFDHLNGIAQKIYEQQIELNRAISGYADPETMKNINQQFKKVKIQLKEEFEKFTKYFAEILQDFKSKESAKQIILLGARYELISMIENLVKSAGIYLSNRFYYVDFDEVRDLLIKKQYFEKVEQQYEQQEPKFEKFIFISPPKQDEAPKDIISIQLIKLDLKKQCWIYNFKMPRCSKYNQFKGLFIRSPEGEEIFELTINLEQNADDVLIQLYPYAVGKIAFDIYVWNHIGFTKSTEKIVLYNQMEVKGKCEPLKNYAAWMVGASNFGVRLDTSDNLKLYKLQQKFKDLCIYNSVVGCDSYGNCAIWGQTYYTDNTEEQPTSTMGQIDKHFYMHQRIQVPGLVFSSGNKFIRKVSCGMGFALMLNSVGQLWSFGFNKYGQLGQGNFDSNYYTTEPRQVCKFTGESCNFLVDICATSKGSSFAIDDKGKFYRWGYNQVEETHHSISDRFGSIINYQTDNILYKNSTPTYIGRNHINGHAKQMDMSEEHYYVLTKEGDLYGWGIVQELGCGQLKDPDQNVIIDIVNPIELMNNIEYVSTSDEHTVVMTKSGEILGWGRVEHFSNTLKSQYSLKPINLTNEYQGQGCRKVKMIRAGINYTVIVRQNNQIEIIGSENALELDPNAFQNKIVNIICSKKEENFVILVEE